MPPTLTYLASLHFSLLDTIAALMGFHLWEARARCLVARWRSTKSAHPLAHYAASPRRATSKGGRGTRPPTSYEYEQEQRGNGHIMGENRRDQRQVPERHAGAYQCMFFRGR